MKDQRRKATMSATKARVWITVLLSISVLGCASLSGSRHSLAGLDARDVRPLFWHIEGHGGANLYVLGSIHVGPRRGWIYPASVLEAFQDAQALVVETDPQEVSPDVISQMIQIYGQLPPGTYLRSLLSDHAWDLLMRQLQNSSLRITTVNRMRPWLLSELLTLEEIRKAGYIAQGGVEASFVAKAGNRSIVPLESAQLQIVKLANLPFAVQEMALLDTLEQANRHPDYLEQLVEAWRSGDEKKLEDLIFETLDKDQTMQPYFEVMLFQRNRAMQAQLEVLLNARQHAGESVFVSLGVAHLVGVEGICQQLEENGYNVTRIKGNALPEKKPTEVSLAVHP